MIRKFLNNKEIIYSVYFWEVENGEKDQYTAEKEICVLQPPLSGGLAQLLAPFH